jgi:methylated-DNA-[protein]-cysteine S-methyltransferase
LELLSLFSQVQEIPARTHKIPVLYRPNLRGNAGFFQRSLTAAHEQDDTKPAPRRRNRVVFAGRRHDVRAMTTHYTIFETALGHAGLAWTAAGIARFQLPSVNADATRRHLLRRTPGAEEMPAPPHIAEAVAAVARYFAGERIDFSDLTLDLTGQDDLFLEIYAAARRIGYGATTTYGGLAKTIGRADWEAAREVGQAMAKNPVALIIPCHRVLAAGGKIGGFSAPGGAETKAKMLELEGSIQRPPQTSLAL